MAKVNMGIVGTGIIGELHAFTFSRLPHAELVAVCDLDEARARGVAKTFGAKSVYSDYRALLEDPSIDAVSVVTPDFAHREIAVAAAKAGKHLLVEKPLATTSDDAEAIVKAAEEAGVTLMVDFHNRCNPPFVQAKAQILEGGIGTPKYIYARLSNTTFVPTQMLSWADQSSALWFLASHTLDMACWLLEDTPSRVYALKRSGVLKEKGIDVPDFHVTVVEFAKGAVVTLENAWILPESEPMVYNFKVEVLGSEGSLYINTSDHRTIETFGQKGHQLPDVLGLPPSTEYRFAGFMPEAIARFVDAVAYGAPVLASGREALLVTKTLEAVERSADTGMPIEL
ncbi:MAG: Gfo/Idh/MocA family oxidoreductase [Trueperaceae bacterium]|nr:MAG: Gfo/Idh/MocA family oxidoreductase [Trueperaceae bacterium]